MLLMANKTVTVRFLYKRTKGKKKKKSSRASARPTTWIYITAREGFFKLASKLGVIECYMDSTAQERFFSIGSGCGTEGDSDGDVNSTVLRRFLVVGIGNKGGGSGSGCNGNGVGNVEARCSTAPATTDL
jgi:hypothetical protein